MDAVVSGAMPRGDTPAAATLEGQANEQSPATNLFYWSAVPSRTPPVSLRRLSRCFEPEALFPNTFERPLA